MSLGCSPLWPGAQVRALESGWRLCAQPAGAVVLAAPAAGAWEALIETRLEALQGGTLQLAAADGPVLQPGRVPYEVPFEAT